MLCEIDLWGNFLTTWAFMTALGAISLLLSSGSLFYLYYVNPSYEKWTKKINPKYPSPSKVKQEILFMLKGLSFSTLAPALSLYLSRHGYSRAYCGVSEEYPFSYLAWTFVLVWLASDFFEFFYHWCGHSVERMWEIHKKHHAFYNPTPFAVIADDWIDQLARASPLLVFPLIMPVNMDMLFFTYAAFFYGYGIFLHFGHEVDYPDAHHPVLNTSYQHYFHHARSIKNKPYYTGFMFKLWDQLFGSVYEGDCVCSKCESRRGKRTKEIWESIEKPDYSLLLSPLFWIQDQEGKQK